MNEANHFKTQEAILAFCLDIAGCEFLDPRHPCMNLFDEEILGNLGYRGMPLWEAAETAWTDKRKGHVEYIFKMSQRLMDLVRAYRDQCAEIDKPGGNATPMTLDIMGRWKSGAILDDEALLRIACVNLKTRIDFVNIWKKMVPLLRVPVKGKSQNFDTTATFQGKTGSKTVTAKGVSKPGFNVLSLNASEKIRKEMGL